MVVAYLVRKEGSQPSNFLSLKFLTEHDMNSFENLEGDYKRGSGLGHLATFYGLLCILLL